MLLLRVMTRVGTPQTRQRVLTNTPNTMNDSSVRVRKPLALLGAGLSLFAAHAAFGQTAAAPETTKTTAAPVASKTNSDEPVALEKMTVTGSFIPATLD